MDKEHEKGRECESLIYDFDKGVIAAERMNMAVDRVKHPHV